MTAPTGVESSNLVGLAPGEVPQCRLLARHCTDLLEPPPGVPLKLKRLRSFLAGPIHGVATRLGEVAAVMNMNYWSGEQSSQDKAAIFGMGTGQRKM